MYIQFYTFFWPLELVTSVPADAKYPLGHRGITVTCCCWNSLCESAVRQTHHSAPNRYNTKMEPRHSCPKWEVMVFPLAQKEKPQTIFRVPNKQTLLSLNLCKLCIFTRASPCLLHVGNKTDYNLTGKKQTKRHEGPLNGFNSEESLWDTSQAFTFTLAPKFQFHNISYLTNMLAEKIAGSNEQHYTMLTQEQ